MNDSSDDVRLPPPAFPPGSRRHPTRNAQMSGVKPKAASVNDALISPDEPLPDRIDPLNDAFISPDEPLPERKGELTDMFRDALAAASDEMGEVVGMDLDPHHRAGGGVSPGDPHVDELMTAVAKLAEDVRRRGQAGLRATPEMSRFEATLRAYCVGYLAGRRAEEPPPPEVDEALPTDG